MKDWKIYGADRGTPQKVISGETLEKAIKPRLKELANYKNASDNHVGEITGYDLEYSPGIIGGQGGACLKIYYKACRPYANSPYDINEYHTVWIYADENLEPPCYGKPSQIKKYRMEAGLTQATMSELFEIPKRTIESWEMGTRIPPKYVEKLIIEKLEQLAEKNKS